MRQMNENDSALLQQVLDELRAGQRKPKWPPWLSSLLQIGFLIVAGALASYWAAQKAIADIQTDVATAKAAIGVVKEEVKTKSDDAKEVHKDFYNRIDKIEQGEAPVIRRLEGRITDVDTHVKEVEKKAATRMKFQ